MSVARSASATTSLPKPGALTPAGTGRSISDRLSPGGRNLVLSLLLLDTFWVPPLSAPRADGRHPTGLRALTQSGEQFQASVAVGRVHTDFFLVGEDSLDRVAACAAVDA